MFIVFRSKSHSSERESFQTILFCFVCLATRQRSCYGLCQAVGSPILLRECLRTFLHQHGNLSAVIAQSTYPHVSVGRLLNFQGSRDELTPHLLIGEIFSNLHQIIFNFFKFTFTSHPLTSRIFFNLSNKPIINLQIIYIYLSLIP